MQLRIFLIVLNENSKNKIMIRKSLFIITLIIFPCILAAQSGRQAGFRAGYRGGIYYQGPMESGHTDAALQGLLSFAQSGIQVTGLRIVYDRQLNDISPNLWFAWGYGGHAGFFYADHINYYGERYTLISKRFCPVFGIDGWIAAEYRFSDMPLVASLNAKPFIEMTIPEFVKFIPFDIGFSVAYVF
jgi:hypothetical protein